MSKMFQKATRKQVRLRMALDGPAGSGKTFTALRFAFGLAGENGRVAVGNTESGAIEKYLGLAPDGIPFDFDICTMSDYAPSSYTQLIQGAGREGYDVLIVDSLSHAWNGVGGALDQVSKKEGNSFTAWKDVTPQHQAMIEAILRSPCHIIVTMRTKVEYVLEKDERGRMVPRKIGLKPVQREGMEYEFDIVCDLDQEHILTVSKTRCPDIDGQVVFKPSANFIAPVKHWLSDGSRIDASHFAVTEEELESFQAMQTAKEKANQPKVDVRQQMANAAKTPGVSPPISNIDAGSAPLVTEGQIAHLKDVLSKLATPPEKLQEMLSKRGVSKIAELSEQQAHELIDGLMKIYGDKINQERESMALQDELEVQSKKNEKEYPVAKKPQAASGLTDTSQIDDDEVPF